MIYSLGGFEEEIVKKFYVPPVHPRVRLFPTKDNTRMIYSFGVLEEEYRQEISAPPAPMKKFLQFWRNVGIGLVIAVLIGLVAWYIPDSVGKKLSSGWIGLIGFTPLTIWVVVRHYRSVWHRPSFWQTLAGFMVLHVLGFIILLRNYPGWRMFWYAPVMIIEVMLIALVIEKVVLHHRV